MEARSITVGNMFKLVESVRQDLVRSGYCFVFEQRPGDSQPRDYIHLVSELADSVVDSMANVKRPETMELQSHHLRAYFQRERFHPKERYSHLYSSQAPKLVLTYEWSMSFVELQGYLNSDNIRHHNWTDAENANFVGHIGDSVFGVLRIMCCFIWCVPSRSSPPKNIDTCPMWIDILFNDQNAIDIKAELKQAERIYVYARYHLVIATFSVLTRAWCLYEIMTRLKSDRKKVSILHNWSKGPIRFAEVDDVLDAMQASYEADKELIQTQILTQFESNDKFQAAVSELVKDSSEDFQHSAFGACFVVSSLFIVFWIFFLIFSPITVPFFAIGICCLVFEIVSPSREYDLMFPDLESPQADADSASSAVNADISIV